MGSLVNPPDHHRKVASAMALVISLLNAVLILLTVTG